MAEVITINTVKELFIILNMNKIIGATFCQVKIIIEFNHVKPLIISGNQKWNGAIPILIKKAEFIIKRFKDIFIFLKILKLIIIIVILIIIIDEAIVWTMKYLTDASEEVILILLYIKGIIAKRFISRPIHIPIQEVDEIEINVLKISKFKKRILKFLFIKKRILNSYLGYEPKSFI